MPNADLGDFTMFYTDEGQGPPVLLVHGWTCDGSDWNWQIPALRQNHRVITVDIRGHGLAVASDQFAMKPEAEAYLSQVTAPAFSFRAGSDPGPAAAWGRAQFQHPYSKAVAWDGTGHFLHHERPAEFNALVEASVEGLPG